MQRKVEKLERKSRTLAPPTACGPSMPAPLSVHQPVSAMASAIDTTTRPKRARDEEVAMQKEPQAIVAPAPYDRSPARKAFTPRRTPQKVLQTDENASQTLQIPTKMNVFADKPASGPAALRARLGSRQ